MAEKEKRVLDVLDYDEIKDIPFVQIFAGVGSGKSYFVERFIKGDPEHHIPKKKILIITSRKAKVVQTLANADLNIGDRITAAQNRSSIFSDPDDDYELYDENIEWLKDEWGKRRVFQKSTICTNAFVEKFLQWKYHPEDITTHLWSLFDIIAIDEVHSLIVDSTYQSAPFYVQSLVKETRRRQWLAEKYPDKFEAPKCKQIILMTGTPDAMDAVDAPENSVTLDLREKCKAVQPQEVEMVSLKTAKSLIAKQLKQRKRIVYFANHTYTVQEFKDAFELKIDDQLMGCSFSKQKKRDELKKHCKPEYDRMEQLENSMYKDSKLPPNIQLFVTTSKNKEGINIDDDNIDIVYVESHLQSDVIQMAGRVRNGIENLYIIENPKGHEANEWKGERRISKYLIGSMPKKRKEWVEYTNLNQYLCDICQHFNIEGLCLAEENATTTAYKHTYVGEYIDWVHEKLPYVRYNYFSNKFCFYKFRERGIEYIRQHEQEFNAILSGETNFIEVIQKWFPAAKIMPYLPKEILAKKALEEFLKNHPNNECQKEEYDALLAQLKKILESDGQTLQPILNKIPLDEKSPVKIQRKGKDRSNMEKYNTYEIKR